MTTSFTFMLGLQGALLHVPEVECVLCHPPLEWREAEGLTGKKK